MVLDYLAWSSDSPLYDAIDAAGSVPCYEDVALPVPTVGGVSTPIVHSLHPRVMSSLGALKGEPVSTSRTSLTNTRMYCRSIHVHIQYTCVFSSLRG